MKAFTDAKFPVIVVCCDVCVFVSMVTTVFSCLDFVVVCYVFVSMVITQSRLDWVELFHSHPFHCEAVRLQLRSCSDLERTLQKVHTHTHTHSLTHTHTLTHSHTYTYHMSLCMYVHHVYIHVYKCIYFQKIVQSSALIDKLKEGVYSRSPHTYMYILMSICAASMA